MALKDAPISVLLENVITLVQQKLPPASAPLISGFVAKFYGNMASSDLHDRNDSDLYGAALSLWNALNQRTTTEPYIHVYNPELTRHGWQSPHTIVEIILQDTPFLVDSIRMALKRLNITAHMMLHQPLHLVRGDDGKISAMLGLENSAAQTSVETVFLIEIDHLTCEAQMAELTTELRSVADEVALAVGDWQPMLARLNEIIAELPKRKHPASQAEIDSCVAFLKWVAAHNFTLMGYRRYDVQAIGGDHEILPQASSSLGLMKNSIKEVGQRLGDMPASARHAALSRSLLILTKSNSKSRVHRPAYVDYIGIKRFDDEGKVVGEDRFIGLYASSIYNTSATQIPLISHRLARIMAASGHEKGSHAYKALLNVLETYPRDELIQAQEEELLATGLGVLEMQERDMLRLFVRRDLYGRFFSCMVYVTKERYNTALRIKTQQILQAYFGSSFDVEFNVYFTEGVLARTHYIVRVNNNNVDVDVNEVQNNLIEAARSWDDRLDAALLSHYGEARGNTLRRRFSAAFPRAYKEEVLPSAAVADIMALDNLSETEPLGMLFYRAQEEQNDRRVRLKLFHRSEPIFLSDVLPMLENMGLRIIGETPYQVRTPADEMFWVLDFSMLLHGDQPFSLEQSQQRFQQAFAAVWYKQLEDDGFNRLVLGAGLTGRQVSVLRAYAKYMRQTGVSFSQAYIEEVLTRYPDIAEQLFALFELRLNPAGLQDEQAHTRLREALAAKLDQVANLDDDRIIRRYVEMIDATLRTNYYQLDSAGNIKPYISFKLAPASISEMPLPLPKFEIFVYSPRVEGVHLRWGKVARGGLRWSDRKEDFRTEVLGLVKAQQVKNTVIVPVGAKGGFYCKQMPQGAPRTTVLEEGKACYRLFIRGLLDVTDNIIGGEVIPPKSMVRHDEDDYYLVVAADKGTATFSDIANEISLEYGHWLGDAFASGGSVGYDHKKMGITARGAWESVKRHFREMGINCQTTDFSCVGIGDMAGDVFGNGMLLCEHTRLVGAFNHQHIFIDPDPDAAKSVVERRRLFELPGSSWDDYDRTLISAGGGIFLRSAKSIPLTPQIQALLGCDKASMAPNELIKALLCLDVDLLWNGGIGTYVKSARESDADVGDRSNDGLRVNGRDVRARIVGEGGNLGFTQLGRVEYASQGGRINTDFTDNVGGVDCSDNEVNIKILLNQLVAAGDLTLKQRNQMLYEMTDDVAHIVITNAYRQSQSISVTRVGGPDQLKEQQRFIQTLEREGKLDRNLEFLPSDEELAERMAAGQGLTRPELAVLVAYGKMVLKEQLNCPEITDEPFLANLLVTSFPAQLQARFGAQLAQHPLRGEIIATRVANMLVNDMGLNFASRMQDETGASVADIACCFAMAREVFGMETLWRELEQADNQLDASTQLALMFYSRRIVRRATRWFLRARQRSWSIRDNIAFFRPAFETLSQHLYEVMDESEVAEHRQAVAAWVAKQVPSAIARQVAHMSSLFSSLDLAQIAAQHQTDLLRAANVYYQLGVKLDLHWFLEQINGQPVGNHWQAMARASFREELDWQQRSLTAVVLEGYKGEGECATILADWIAEHEQLLSRWRHMLADFKTSSTHEFAKFSVALRELNLLQLHCRPL
ncbi:NAD-glutamate dehydrogenase [Aeromonas cavernicola]|uniref:NAD-glutamate dehydrogenase n=1 Tax=Aeromonas cavernicola TaxID=1006623 RepID=A0A2H9U3P6_9GAMM|nr:NAD-glutamate dehydrogenase [Aeromonas cavernicola]PJG58650.1 NAD-glutamate dehydrogenase [Aeromonas cavernicola]